MYLTHVISTNTDLNNQVIIKEKYYLSPFRLENEKSCEVSHPRSDSGNQLIMLKNAGNSKPIMFTYCDLFKAIKERDQSAFDQRFNCFIFVKLPWYTGGKRYHCIAPIISA